MNSLRDKLILTSIVFLLSQLILVGVLAVSGHSYFDPGTWMRWDSGHYLDIANKGYEMFPCAGKFGFPLDVTFMCGNTGWFPGYPFAIRMLSPIIQDATLAGVLLSKTFYFLTLLMVLIIAGIDKISVKNVTFLLLAALSFGFIYYNAVFPISSVLFFSLLGFHFFLKRKLLLLGFCCSLASFFYPTGFLISFAFAITLFIEDKRLKGKNGIRPLIPLFFGGAGVFLAFLVFQIQVDDWTAFMQVQAKYGHGIESPIKNIGIMLKRFSSDVFAIENTIILQSSLVIVGYLGLSFLFFYKKSYREELSLLSYIYITLFFIFPWVVGGNLSMYRAESLLLPFVFLTQDWKMPWMTGLLAVQVFVGGIMSYLFFTSVLI